MSKELINVLHNIQQQLKAPKGQNNTFGKYRYRSCEDIVEAVKPLLPEGYALRMTDRIEMLGNRFYVCSSASLISGSDGVDACGYARESDDKKGMDSAQITGAASSYARKYALNGLFAIDDTKDSDTDEYKRNNESKPSKAPKVIDNSPTGVADRLINKMQSFKTWPELKAWDAIQDVKDARDKLALDDIELSNKVELVFDELRNRLPI